MHSLLHSPSPSTYATELHRQMIQRKYGMFIHFGLNTFHDQEWTDGTLDASSYHPKGLDTDDWARTASEAGMRYVILTTKHHDGFCLWDSPHTEYSIAASPMKKDVVAAMAESCRKFGLDLGLYYSLWDRHWGNGVMRRHSFEMDAALSNEQKQAYALYMDAQIHELMSSYGPICELWLDGGWNMPREAWEIPRIYDTVRSLQANCAVGVNWSIGHPDQIDIHALHPDQQQEGYPIRYFPSDFRLGDPELPGEKDPKCFSHEGELYYMPFESTVCLNQHWFYHTGDTELKRVEDLAALYRQATAQDNILILNSPPNREGRMTEANKRRLRELAAHLGLC